MLKVLKLPVFVVVLFLFVRMDRQLPFTPKFSPAMNRAISSFLTYCSNKSRLEIWREQIEWNVLASDP